MALIIDDVGANPNALERFLRIPAALSFAVIPNTRYASRCVQMIRAEGRTPLLHLPMEPIDSHKMPSGAVTTVMTDAEIVETVERYLASLPQVVGVNNHMGSKATQDERVMRAVLRVLAEKGLFFVDSRTAPDTVVSSVAAELGVPHAARDGRFLDDGGDSSQALDVLLELGKIARTQGQAIGIGHVHRGTADAIRMALPELEAMGVSVVSVSELVR
ncbi:MAG: divergent polysaccharide deacetylase family protein [Armatimonadota bacterium]